MSMLFNEWEKKCGWMDHGQRSSYFGFEYKARVRVLFEHQCRGAACAVSWGHMHRPASSNLCLLTATG
jgi:hypothetical protein